MNNIMLIIIIVLILWNMNIWAQLQNVKTKLGKLDFEIMMLKNFESGMNKKYGDIVGLLEMVTKHLTGKP